MKILFLLNTKEPCLKGYRTDKYRCFRLRMVYEVSFVKSQYFKLITIRQQSQHLLPLCAPIVAIKISKCSKPGGLDLSRRNLDRESQSQHWQRVSLDSRKNLDTFKKLVSTIKISRSRSRNLDFVSTPPFSPKSLDLSKHDIFGKS